MYSHKEIKYLYAYILYFNLIYIKQNTRFLINSSYISCLINFEQINASLDINHFNCLLFDKMNFPGTTAPTIPDNKIFWNF